MGALFAKWLQTCFTEVCDPDVCQVLLTCMDSTVFFFFKLHWPSVAPWLRVTVRRFWSQRIVWEHLLLAYIDTSLYFVQKKSLIPVDTTCVIRKAVVYRHAEISLYSCLICQFFSNITTPRGVPDIVGLG